MNNHFYLNEKVQSPFGYVGYKVFYQNRNNKILRSNIIHVKEKLMLTDEIMLSIGKTFFLEMNMNIHPI